MAQRIFLHVGTPKSGTTFLQEVLWKNTAVLAEQGLLLPGTFQLQYTAAKAITQRRGVEQRTRNRHGVAWARLVRQIRQWQGSALVSHELFAPATREQARAALAKLGDGEVHLILTIRALHKQLPAAWQEQVKGGHRISYAAFLEQVRTGTGGRGAWFWSVQDALSVIDRWRASLPPARVHVVTCPPGADDPSLLWRRFSSVLGIDGGAYDLEVSRVNRSLGVAESELLRRVQSARDYRFRDTKRHAWTRRLLSTQLLAQRDGDPIRLPEGTRPWVEQRTRSLSEGLAARGYDVVGSLDDLSWQEPNASARLISDVSADELAQLSAWTISRLQEQLVQRQPRTAYPSVGPEDGEAGILELLEHIRAADLGAKPRAPAVQPERTRLRAFAHRLRP